MSSVSLFFNSLFSILHYSIGIEERGARGRGEMKGISGISCEGKDSVLGVWSGSGVGILIC